MTQIISEQGHQNKIDEVLEFINMIQKGGRSLLELADEILSIEPPKSLKSDQLNLTVLKDKLETLYNPQATSKNIQFAVNICSGYAATPFSKNKLLQIAGNLISNAMKFTPAGGKVTVDMRLESDNVLNKLYLNVSDTGVGLDKTDIDKILNGNASSTDGTSGEQGYGFGLALVKHLVEVLKGTIHINSEPGKGAAFEVVLPLDQ